MPLRLQQNRKHAGASEEPCGNQNLYCYYICSFVYTDVKNNFHMCKNSSVPLINAALWHYLGTYNLDFRHENNSTPRGINQGNMVLVLTLMIFNC